MLVEHHKRANQFVAKHRPVLAKICQGRERPDDVFVAFGLAIVGLDAIGRKYNRGGYAITVFDRCKFGAPFVERVPAARDAAGRDRFAKIGLERLVEFRLRG